MTESNSESVRVLEKGIEQAHAALLAVREDQLTLPTPCEQWDVGQLVAHLALDPANMLDMATGGAPDWSATPDRVEDPAGTFRAGSDALLAHWRESEESADWQIAELAVHTWDVATATGQPTESLDPEVAERGLAFMSGALKPELRGNAFGPERTAPEGASVYERIAAFSGRVVR
ncbi:maleylpyruvate isomerase family mycothiol-dependent enzyme [Nocardioides sp.]|uniref:maleylpyruvate isomerase family mycothiol-dependent enzyme n=1 Tax=Nocardioides sp. TaxID=35761 RepID=UPI002ED143CB